jgi:hypothetical protein
MRGLVHLPRGLPDVTFEPALAIDSSEWNDLSALAAGGWRWTDPLVVAGDASRYRQFVRSSSAELGVAKSGYVASRCGWFSDRSACYLACGRPVIAQDTGWTGLLPSGEGLLAFADAAEAAAGVAEVLGDYERHCKAARALACELFDARIVLTRLIEIAGAPQ